VGAKLWIQDAFPKMILKYLCNFLQRKRSEQIPENMHQAGFVNLFGKPNAGKSTLLNALAGEKLAITSPKVQTTRHRIIGILNQPDFQIVFSDTPGIITPLYKLHERMMGAVSKAIEDADVALLVADIMEDVQENAQIFTSLCLKMPAILVLNKMDRVAQVFLDRTIEEYKLLPFVSRVVAVSALHKTNLSDLLAAILQYLPPSEKYYPEGELTDRPMKFFVGELIREQIFLLYREEIPYHTAVVVTAYEEKTTLVKIRAEIVVQRQTQKAILLGEKGSAIKELGTRSRLQIESFIDRKVFLELFVKVREGWRDSDLFLKEYGY
jgi:GTP-binding protein Era